MEKLIDSVDNFCYDIFTFFKNYLHLIFNNVLSLLLLALSVIRLLNFIHILPQIDIHLPTASWG